MGESEEQGSVDLGTESQRVPGDHGAGQTPEYLHRGEPVRTQASPRTPALALQSGPGKEVVTGSLPASVCVVRPCPGASLPCLSTAEPGVEFPAVRLCEGLLVRGQRRGVKVMGTGPVLVGLAA